MLHGYGGSGTKGMIPKGLKTDSSKEAAVEPDDLAEQAAQRADLYLLLAALFLEALDIEALERLRSKEMATVMGEAGFTLDEDFFETPADQLLESLAVEFTRLFLFSPDGRLAPYESLQRPKASGLLQGPESEEVSAYIEAAGFNYSNKFKEMPDHISVQLEFLAHLLQEESSAWKKGKTEDAINAIRLQNEFFNRFCGTWVFSFMEKVIASSEMVFYRSLARFTADFLNEEQADMEEYLILAENELLLNQ